MKILARLFLICLVIPCIAAESPFAINIVHSGDLEVLEAYRQSIQEKLPQFRIQTSDLKKSSVLPKCPITIAVGNVALAQLLKDGQENVLASFIPRTTFERIFVNKAEGKRTISAIYADPDPALQMGLAKAIYGRNTEISFLVSSDSTSLKTYIKGAARRIGIQPIIFEFKEDTDISSALNAVRDTDVLVGLPDERIFNKLTLRSILLTTYRHSQGMIGFSAGMVKAGAIAGIYHTVEDYAAETVQWIREFQLENKVPPSRYARTFDIVVNNPVAQSLNLPAMDERELKIVMNGK